MKRYYVVDGAELICNCGKTPCGIVPTSQNKLKKIGKLQVTDNDKNLVPPFFKGCSKWPYTCKPDLLAWENLSINSAQKGKSFVMSDSKIKCRNGGVITVLNPGQTIAYTGEEYEEPPKSKPELLGDILFVGGYQSDSVGGTWNAIRGKDPDSPDKKFKRGKNIDSNNKTDPRDSQTAYEVEKLEDTEADKDSFTVPVHKMTPAQIKGMFWGYWNQEENNFDTSQTYSKYFNAQRREHYFSGSRGMGSGAADRIDRGIAMGYDWATRNWNINPKKQVDKEKKDNPFRESFSPPYRPITIVGHSQGVAMCTGIALGILRYAKDLNWEKIALNIIYLGMHQPLKLDGDEYKQLIKRKVEDFYAKTDGAIVLNKILLSKHKEGIKDLATKLGNNLSGLFNHKNKLLHHRGISEHIEEICDGTENFLKRAVQFTFCNDRGDLVIRDSDMPNVDNACSQEGDNTSLYSVEYFDNAEQVPADTAKCKKIETLKKGGVVAIPKYSVIKRLNYNEKKDEVEDWGDEYDYTEFAINWGNALYEFKKSLALFKKSKYFGGAASAVALINLEEKFKNLVYTYARLQVADLYAHFAPVAWINNKKILLKGDFADSLGTASIWDRIRKKGEETNKFYRVEYGNEDNESESVLTEEKKRNIDKNYVEGNGRQLLIDIQFVGTNYIGRVIKAYVEYNKDSELYLYKDEKKLK